MARQAKIVLVGESSSTASQLVSELRGQSLTVEAQPRPTVATAGPPDLVLLDASTEPDVVAAVRAVREQWPEQTTPVLVLGSQDPDVSAAAIEAGATDSVIDALAGPLASAHVRRLLKASETLRSLLEEERVRAKRESLALAAADVAVPLGELLDELEAVMARAPVDKRLDELLELTGRAVDAVDRLRRLATSTEFPAAERDGT